MPSEARRRIRSQIAVTARHHPDADLSDLRRDLATEKLADYIDQVVASAPPLTEDQLSRLRGLLGGGAK